jgi:hypothetical protein
MRRDPDFFGDQELELVYIAKRLSEAKNVEALLSAGGLDYLVEPDQYFGGLIFQRARTGAFFYVLRPAADSTRKLLKDNRYRPQEATGEGGTL